MKNKNKKRTRASLFQSLEDGKQEIFCAALEKYELWRFGIERGNSTVHYIIVWDLAFASFSI